MIRSFLELSGKKVRRWLLLVLVLVPILSGAEVAKEKVAVLNFKNFSDLNPGDIDTQSYPRIRLSPERESLLREGIDGGAGEMRVFTAVIERCPDTGLYVGFVPGFAGAHSQGESLDELNRNLKEVIEMLLEDGDPALEGEFVGIQNVVVA